MKLFLITLAFSIIFVLALLIGVGTASAASTLVTAPSSHVTGFSYIPPGEEQPGCPCHMGQTPISAD